MWYPRNKNAVNMYENVYFNLQHCVYTENKSVHLYFVEFLINRISITYFSISLHFRIEHDIFIMTINLCKSVVNVRTYLGIQYSYQLSNM